MFRYTCCTYTPLHMKLKNLKFLFFLLFALTTFTACKDDKEDDDVAPSKKEMIIAHEWKGDKVFVKDINVEDIPGAGTNAQTFKTLRISFKEDNTYIATFDVNGQQQNFDGTWGLNADETVITLEMFGDLQIKQLTETNFDVTTTVSTDNVAFIARLMGIDPALITLFTGGQPVKTEMRFIK